MTSRAASLERRKAQRADEEADLIDTNVLTPDEINGLITAAANDDDRLAIRFLFASGARIGEMAGLKWTDCEWSSNRVFIRSQLNNKGELVRLKTASARRAIDLDTDLMHQLKKLRAGANEFVFGNSAGGPMDRDNFRKRCWAASLRRAGLRHVRLHDARHTHASLLIASGADIVAISRRLGHKDPSITLRIYSHRLQLRESPGLGDMVAKAIGCFLVVGSKVPAARVG